MTWFRVLLLTSRALWSLLGASASDLATTASSSAALPIIAAAVSPAILVTAAALIGSGIAQKHAAMGDRIRALSAELRAADLQPSHRDYIQRELPLFAVRVRRVGIAHRMMYLAMACFIAMILLLAVQQRSPAHGGLPLLVAFTVGLAIMLTGVVVELSELRLATRTLNIEIDEAGRVASSG